jgi:hypothetical protein
LAALSGLAAAGSVFCSSSSWSSYCYDAELLQDLTGSLVNIFHIIPMKGIGIIVAMALLNAGLSKAGDYTATNNVPEQIHNLMDSQNYAFDQKHFSIPKHNTNSLRNVQFTKRQQFILLLLPTKKFGWSLWNNSNFKYVGRNTDQINLFAPYSALPQIEYDITYSFDF